MPCCSWTTRSPGDRSVKDWSFWRLLAFCFFGLRPAFFAPAHQRGTALGQNGDGAPLHTGGQAAHGQGDLAGLGQLLQVKIQRGHHAGVPEHIPQQLGLPLGGAEHDGGKAAVLVVGQVAGRGLQTGAEGGQLLAGEAQRRPGRRGVLPHQEAVQIDNGELPAEVLAQRLVVGGVPRRFPPEQTGLQQAGDVLILTPAVVLCALAHPGGVAEQQDRVRGQVVGGAGEVRIDEVKVAVGGGEAAQLADGPGVVLQRLGQGGKVLQLPAAVGGGHLFPAVVDVAGQPQQPAGGQPGQSLGGGQDLRAVDVLHPALGGRVEYAHAVQFVPPELRPDGLLGGGRIEVQNAAAHGKLAGALHLLAPGIARSGQPVAELVQVVARPHLQLKAGPRQCGGGQRALEEALHRGGHHRGGAVGHGL